MNSLSLEEMFMKLESQNVINVFKVSKNKKMIVLNKDTNALKDEILKNLL